MILPRVLDSARNEFLEATEFYLGRDSGIAFDFVDRVENAFQEIGKDPRRFPQLESVTTERDIRRVLLSRFPFILVYEIFNEQPWVLAVAHASRRPGYWLERSAGE